jgi:hypothetical protein
MLITALFIVVHCTGRHLLILVLVLVVTNGPGHNLALALAPGLA